MNCPTREHLIRFLSNALTAVEEAQLSAHLETCNDCVQTLELLTSAQQLDTTEDSANTIPSSTSDSQGSKHFHKNEQPSGLSGEELGKLRGLLHKHRHGWITSPALAAETGFPEVPGYRIEAEIGRGGMGVVYRAQQSQLNRPVALKMILNSQYATQEQVVRFLAEAQTCAAIRHPGIVQVFDVGQCAGVPYYSMELLEDGTLAEYASKNRVPPWDAAALIEDIARAIHVAHLHGVVHRDLKPANILLQNVDLSDGRKPTGSATQNGSRRATKTLSQTSSILRTQSSPLSPKVTDFGLARRFDLDQGLTNTGALLGTPDYMAPEQVVPGKHHIGPAVDVYSLGAMLYFLLTGRPPFSAGNVMETLEAVRFRDPTPPSSIDAAVPHDLSIICLHCLEKFPNQRYETAEHLADDLQRYRNGQPISARPISDFERLRKWAGRNPGISALAGSLLATIMISLLLVTWQWTRAVDARNSESLRADSETKAKQAEAAARRDAQLYSASYALDQGIEFCKEGRSREGLWSMVRALEILPENEPDLEFAIRANIDGWRRQACKEEFCKNRGTPFTSIAFSPDGQKAVLGDWGIPNGKDGPAEIKLVAVNSWDAPPIWTIEHPGAVWSVAFSPDGKLVALGGFNATSLILDAATGEPRTSPLPHSGRVYSVAFSPDGKILATAGHVSNPSELGNRDHSLGLGTTGELRLWEVSTGSQIGEPIAFPFRINCLTWHSSGQSIALGGLNLADEGKGSAGQAVIFDLASSQVIGPSMSHPDAVSAVAFAPDTDSTAKGKLLTGCRDGFIRLWDYTSGTVDPAPLYQTRTINSLAFSSDGRLLAAASGHHEPRTRVGTGEVHVWDMGTRTRLAPPPFERVQAQSQKMHSLAFTPDNRRLAAVSEHGRAWLWTWDRPPGVRPTRSWSFPQRCDVSFSPDGRRLVLNVLATLQRGFNEQPSEFHLLDNADGRTLAVLPHPTNSWARFSPDSRLMATFGYPTPAVPANVGLWKLENGERIPLPPEFPSYVRTLRFTSDSMTLYTVSLDGKIQAWDTTSLNSRGLAIVCFDETEDLKTIDLSETRALISGSSGTRLVQLPEGIRVATLSDMSIAAVGFSNDGSTVFATEPDAASPSRLWNAVDGSPLNTPIAPRERFARMKGSGLTVDLAPKQPDLTFNNSAPNIHFSVSEIHPSGRYYVSVEGGATDFIHFWSITGKPIGPPLPHGRLHQVAFSPDGQSLITSSHFGTVRQWTVPSVATESIEELKKEFSRLQ